MLIGGIQRFSLIDYPSKTSCIIFTQGCNFRCHFCHNPELIELDASKDRIMQKPFFDFLEERKGKLDAVVITGGEPTLQRDLTGFIRQIKDLGYCVKIDTNGTNPILIKSLIDQKLIDSVAMDVKAPWHRYSAVVGIDAGDDLLQAIEESVRIIINSEIDYEFRTTTVSELLAVPDILEIASLIRGAERYVLQRFVPSRTYNTQYLNARSMSDEELELLVRECEGTWVRRVIVR
jgi:pyruvate formate lyase activating enzyme